MESTNTQYSVYHVNRLGYILLKDKTLFLCNPGHGASSKHDSIRVKSEDVAPAQNKTLRVFTHEAWFLFKTGRRSFSKQDIALVRHKALLLFKNNKFVIQRHDIVLAQKEHVALVQERSVVRVQNTHIVLAQDNNCPTTEGGHAECPCKLQTPPHSVRNRWKPNALRLTQNRTCRNKLMTSARNFPERPLRLISSDQCDYVTWIAHKQCVLEPKWHVCDDSYIASRGTWLVSTLACQTLQ